MEVKIKGKYLHGTDRYVHVNVHVNMHALTYTLGIYLMIHEKLMSPGMCFLIGLSVPGADGGNAMIS